MDWLPLESLGQIFNLPVATAPGARLTLDAALLLFLLVMGVFWITSQLEKRAIAPLLAHLKMSPGPAFTTARTIHYLLALVGLVLGMQLFHVDWGQLGVVFGLLSIGIGFGLQNLTSNFVAGLIIMYERPIKPGDFVAVGEHMGLVKEVQLRATTIVTMDNTKIVVPNSEFISKHVINRSFGNARVRLHIPVRLAYGADPAAVREALLVAANHPRVLATPAPDVWLTEFATDGLFFELLVWIEEPEDSNPIRSAISYAIYRECQARGLQMPHAQLDLHVQGTVPVVVERRDQDTPGNAGSLSA